ncbi:hypothetical protein OFN30_32050, partial [Escherichia coli]|nr:hypothetical protein [Escherichia coli]
QALFDSASAVWHILQSTNGQIINTTWGAPGDIAVQNDYDADGRCDLAVWNNASNAVWIIRRSSNLTTRYEYWGTTGDIPVPAFYRR